MLNQQDQPPAVEPGTRPLTVAWLSFFPVEWLPDAPEEVRRLPRQHPASWQRVLFDHFAADASVRLHVIVIRKQLEHSLSFERRGVMFHLIKVPGGIRASTFFWVDTFLISRVLKGIRPDVIHAWGTEQGAALVANRLGYPRVVTVQGLMNWYGQVSKQSFPERVAALLEKHSLPRSPLVTTESKFSVRWLHKHYPDLHVEQIEHAPDPVFHGITRWPTIQPMRFLFVGGLDHRKGGDVLLLALEQLRSELEFEIIVVGRLNPEVESMVIERISPELWKQVVFKENLSHLQIAEELKIATMAICTSRADVSPNSVKEAVVAGVPVIGSAVGGIPDYVLPGRNGLLVQPGNVPDLVDAIRVACAHPLFQRGQVESGVLTEMREYLSPIKMGQRFRETYQIAIQLASETRKGR